MKCVNTPVEIPAEIVNDSIVPESPEHSPTNEIVEEVGKEVVKDVGEKQERKPKYNKDNKDNKQRDNKKPTRNQQLYESWEKELEVTLETPIPELPKERLEEPSNKELRENLQALDKEINQKRDNIVKLKVEKDESIQAGRKMRDEKKGDLKGLFSQAKELSSSIGDLNEEKKMLEADIEKISKQKDLIVKGIFGKKLIKATECENKIEDLSYRQRTERLTATEERVILKDLKELQNSLPMIKEVDSKSQEMKEIMDKKKVIGKKIHGLLDQKNILNAQIDEVKALQKGKEGESPDEKKEEKSKHPITIKMDLVKDAIENLKKEKKELKDEHEKKYQSWKEQNETELKIKFIKRKKAVLQKKKDDADYKAEIKAESDKAKAEIEEYELMYGKPKKYQVQIDLCANLINYLNSFKNKSDESSEEIVGFNQECVESKLASGDWKKEKVHILKNKRDEEEQGVQPGQKKHKNKKNKTNKKAEEPKLTLTIETLSYFEEIKCSPPTYAKEIQGVVDSLEEKKAYFTRISDELNDGKEVTEEKEEKTEEKREGKRQKEKVNLDNEEMFPSMDM